MRWRVICALLMGSCGGVTVGPFVPAGSPICGSDADCLAGEHCAFPAVDTRARCMPGESPIDTPPDDMRRKDAAP